MLDALKAAGVTWVRIDPPWGWLERDGKGVYDATRLADVDRCVELTRQRGINIIMATHETPGWANNNAGAAAPPTNPTDFRDFMQTMAARYRGKVRAWEIWNEPNNSTFWTGSVGSYVSLLKAGHDGVKAGDSGALVVLGGVMYNDDAYIRSVYASGGKGYFDVVATHPYQGVGDEPPEHADDGNRSWFTHLPAVRRVMADYGDLAKPIWLTEFGWSAHANTSGTPSWAWGVSEAMQADFAVRAIDYAASNWPYVGMMTWFKERSWSISGSDWFQLHTEGYGLLRADRSQRPVYGALRSRLTGTG